MVITKEHALFAFDCLVASYQQRAPLRPEFDNNKYPVFVSWHKNAQSPTGEESELELRGCIGNFKAEPLIKNLSEYAVISARQDSRFEEIAYSELKDMNCTVSILLNFDDAENYLDWEIGKHGLRLKYTLDNGRILRSTYLPEIAKENFWTKEETIRNLLRKAGFNWAIGQHVYDAVELTRYQSEKVRCNFAEWKAWRDKRVAIDERINGF
ncbi:AMME syndrome candidate protein 1 protein [Actinomortierella ambigua]|nr:AMME syndrome candidate protein 1 protein [Actinomortierella ambigua]